MKIKMDAKGRRYIVEKGEIVKKHLLDNNIHSILIVGGEESGKSMLCSYLENSLKKEPYVMELDDATRKAMLRDLSKVNNSTILVDGATNLSINSLLKNIDFLKKNNNKIVLLSRNYNEFIGEIKDKVDLYFDM